MSLLASTRSVAFPSDEAEALTQFSSEDTVLAISQSGETFDTLEVVRAARANKAQVISLCNVVGSSLERLATKCLNQYAGSEICVLSTKSIISQVTIMARIALEQGMQSGVLSSADYDKCYSNLRDLPSAVDSLLGSKEKIVRLAEKYHASKHWFFIGRGVLFPVALESALKFKEVSYHHAEGMPAGFFKHGTISLIDEDFFTVALLPSMHPVSKPLQATLSNVSEICARNGPVIGFGPESLEDGQERLFVDYIPLPLRGDVIFDSILHLVAGQLLAYHCAVLLGRNIDQPRSLAKSVTVR